MLILANLNVAPMTCCEACSEVNLNIYCNIRKSELCESFFLTIENRLEIGNLLLMLFVDLSNIFPFFPDIFMLFSCACNTHSAVILMPRHSF